MFAILVSGPKTTGGGDVAVDNGRGRNRGEVMTDGGMEGILYEGLFEQGSGIFEIVKAPPGGCVGGGKVDKGERMTDFDVIARMIGRGKEEKGKMRVYMA